MPQTAEQTQVALTGGKIAPLVRDLEHQQADDRRQAPIHRRPAPAEGRFELKFTVPVAEAYRVDAWLRAHPAAFRTLYPVRRVNSLYFDTHDLAGYTQNLDGDATRTKVRVRWYGICPRFEDGVLEVKRKQGAIGWKEQYAIPETIDPSHSSWVALLRAMREALPPVPRFLLGAVPVPVIINSYDRAYFASADSVVRVTVDRNLAAFDQRRSPRPNLRWRIPLPDHRVVELKCPVSARTHLIEVADSFPCRIDRNSKYVAAVSTSLSA